MITSIFSMIKLLLITTFLTLAEDIETKLGACFFVTQNDIRLHDNDVKDVKLYRKNLRRKNEPSLFKKIQADMVLRCMEVIDQETAAQVLANLGKNIPKYEDIV